MKFFHNLSPHWLEAQYRLYQRSPEAVPPDWQTFFAGFELGEAGTAGGPIGSEKALPFKQSAVESLIYRYRDVGHLLACADPLHVCPISHPFLDLEAFGLSREDLKTVFRPLQLSVTEATLQDIIDLLRATYCGSIGVEYMHIQNPEERKWLKERMEPVRNRPKFSLEKKKGLLEKLFQAALFERVLHRKFLGQKRFSLEGAEAVIPFLDHLVRRSAEIGISDIVLATTHRGRLNILANILGKPLETIFAEFEDNLELGWVGEGDVKYHKGFSNTLDFSGGQQIHLTMASNPSHLESVDPVAEGKCRARQEGFGAGGEKLVLPLVIHGDAAFAGQGVVAETLNLSQLEGFKTGGTLHLIINNQIGFTTRPEDARSTVYATDIAKMLMVPIFHVNGDDPEAVLFVGELALDYRQAFGRDVVVEIICYRRHGHNEGDEPYFTQPMMYERIKEHLPVDQLYADRLREEGLRKSEIEAMLEKINSRLDKAAERPGEVAGRGFSGKWSEIQRNYSPDPVPTGVDRQILLSLGKKFLTIPEGFKPHPKIRKLFSHRRQTLTEGDLIDWPLAEALAFATLLNEGHTVRLSGQDSRRGTFNQRHSTLFDFETGETCMPLATAASKGATLHIFDSTLSEAAILGFEYGYSLESPNALVIWEAQFGDFANGAQVIIDQFIVSSRTKWDRGSGLTLFLPHGYEGQGPEHSSARIERFLQGCAGHNILVSCPSTPAQFFHLLRRQLWQSFRRPLVVFTPKSLLRLPACRSSLDDFNSGHFREVLTGEADPERVRRVLFCSGKIFYDLDDRQREEKRTDIAIIRLEQFYPLRTDLLKDCLEKYPKAEKFAWVQEEPSNMGAWNFLRPHLAKMLGHDPVYIGRDEAAAPAVGSHRLHQQEQMRLLEEAFAL